MCMYTMCAPGGQETTLYLLGMELQIVGNHSQLGNTHSVLFLACQYLNIDVLVIHKGAFKTFSLLPKPSFVYLFFKYF